MRVLIDHCLSNRLARALAQLTRRNEPPVTPFCEHFKNVGLDDEVWIPELAKEEDQWVFVSANPRILNIAAERKKWLESGLTAFFLDGAWGNLTFWEKSWRLLRWWPLMMEAAQKFPPGTGFVVPCQYTGRLRQLRISKKEMRQARSPELQLAAGK